MTYEVINLTRIRGLPITGPGITLLTVLSLHSHPIYNSTHIVTLHRGLTGSD